jgi:hypothetical protein
VATPLNADQLYALARTVGLDPAAAEVAAAVALAESGGNPEAVNAADPHGGSHGLWQINGAHRSKPDFTNVYNPAANARLMAEISGGGTNWRPWGAFTNGSYKQHMGAARDARRKIEGEADRLPEAERKGVFERIAGFLGGDNPAGKAGQQVGGVVEDTAGALMALGRLAATLTKGVGWLANAGWKRLLMVLLGLIGLVIAAFGLFGALVPSGAKQAVRSTAANVTKVRTAKAATA